MSNHNLAGGKSGAGFTIAGYRWEVAAPRLGPTTHHGQPRVQPSTQSHEIARHLAQGAASPDQIRGRIGPCSGYAHAYSKM